MKKILITTASIILAGAVALTAFAQATTTPTTSAANVAVKIACVGGAVNTREQAIDTAMTTHTSAVNAAYTARATALQQAYSLTTLKDVRAGVKTAWSTFNTAIKAAKKDWNTSRNAAWSAYRKTAIACKAPANTGDGVNSVSEVSGN
jgi:uncharacterized protein YxeA